MAPTAKRLCRYLSCQAVVDDGFCDLHQEKVKPKTSKERGFDWDWYRLRATKLARNPVCELKIECQGMVATEVDHTIPKHIRPDLRLVWSNLKSTCIPCHRVKSERDRHTDWSKVPGAQQKVDYRF